MFSDGLELIFVFLGFVVLGNIDFFMGRAVLVLVTVPPKGWTGLVFFVVFGSVQGPPLTVVYLFIIWDSKA